MLLISLVRNASRVCTTKATVSKKTRRSIQKDIPIVLWVFSSARKLS